MRDSFSFCDEVNERSAKAFVDRMSSLPSRSACNVYISTPGGDIFAGNDMVNAVEHALERGCKLSFEMGAIVASMGASLIAAARARGCRVVARENTQMMFHGCYCISLGGADELRDAAKCLEDFNRVVIDNLKRCGVEDCEEWFAADRQKWLNANEAVELGLADEIVGVGESADEDAVTVARRFAARWNGGSMAEEIKLEEAKPEEAAAPVETAEETTAEVADEKPADVENETPVAPVDMVTRSEADERVRGMQSAMQKQINDLKIQLGDALHELKEAKAAAEAEITRLGDALNAKYEECKGLADTATSLRAELSAKVKALDVLNAGANVIINSDYHAKLKAARTPEEREEVRREELANRKVR